MDGKKRESEEREFRMGLSRLSEKAAGRDGHIAIGEILACFPGRELTQEQVSQIYQYAEEEHIVIEDYQLHDTRSVTVGAPKKLTGEEKEYFKMYEEDLKAVPPLAPDEEDMLAERLLEGDDSVLQRLTEGYLSPILDLAREYVGRGVLIGDLVQEGNMALLSALEELADGRGTFLSGGLRDYIMNRAKTSMQRLISEQGGYDRTSEKVARETNRLLAATMELEDELGREATLTELSRRVGLPEDEVRELVQISLNAAEFSMADEKDEPDSDDGIIDMDSV